MKRIIAYCGIVCSDCGAFKATQNNDDAERKRIAEMWNKQYGKDFKPEDINCDGCLTRGQRIFSYCKGCEIRRCAMERNVENCAYCEDYACERLLNLINEFEPEAKERLDEIRASFQET